MGLYHLSKPHLPKGLIFPLYLQDEGSWGPNETHHVQDLYQPEGALQVWLF